MIGKVHSIKYKLSVIVNCSHVICHKHDFMYTFNGTFTYIFQINISDDSDNDGQVRADRTYCLTDMVILLLPRKMSSQGGVGAFSLCILFYLSTICPSGPPWNEGHRPNGSSRDQCI